MKWLPEVLREITKERERQETLWGEQNLPDGTGEVWELVIDPQAAKDACDEATAAGELTYARIFFEEAAEVLCESDREKLKVELTQTGAVIAKWLEKLKREDERVALGKN